MGVRQAWNVLFAVLCLSEVSECFQWRSSGQLADGSTIPACYQQDVLLDWDYMLAADEHVVNVEWRFVPEHSSGEVTLATQVYGHFFADSSISRHIQFVPSAGLRLLRVTAADMGTYTVRVHLNQNGVSHTFVQTARLVVTDSSMAVGDVLEARFQGAMLMNSTQEHQLILSCGIIDPLWIPKVNIVWTTPGNQTLPSTSQDNGHYLLAVPNPFLGGNYTCKIDNSSPAAACLSSDSPLQGGATMTVDPVEGKLSLLASEMASMKAELSSLQRESGQMSGQAHSLLDNSTDLTGLIQALENQKDRL